MNKNTFFIWAICFSISEVAISEPLPSQVSEILNKVKARNEVLNVQSDLTLQFVLPPQYSMCLYSAAVQSGSEATHSYFLEQIDFLVNAGLSTSNIKGLISYGHAITNMEFSSKSGRQVGSFNAHDLKEQQEYTHQSFKRHSCDGFSQQSVQATLKDFIRKTLVSLQ